MTAGDRALGELGAAARPADGVSRQGIAGLAALVALSVVVVFADTLPNAYQLDDYYRIVDNPELEQVGPIWRHFVDPGTSSRLETIVQYRPLLPLSLSLDNAAAGALGVQRRTMHHAGNIAVHALTSALVFLLFLELLRRDPPPGPAARRDLLAFGAALLFAVHPVSGVPVNYLCARDLLLMMLFAVASLLVYARMRRRGDSAAGWAGALLLLALSLLSKTNGVVFPAIIWCFELFFGGGGLRRRGLWLRPLPFVAVVAAFFGWTELVLGFSDAGALVVKRSSPLEYPLTELKVHLFYYLRNIVWPFHMRARPLIAPVTSLADPAMLAGAVVVFGSLALAFTRLRRRAPLVAFCIAAYWIFFAPTSSVLPFRSMATDYRQYPSLPFLFLAVVLGLHRLLRPRMVPVALGVLLVWFAATASYMNRIWRTEKSFWEQSVRYGGTALSHTNLGLALMEEDPDAAQRELLRAIEMEPKMIFARINLGLLHIAQKRREEGVRYLSEAVKLSPNWEMTQYWMAEGYRRLGETNRAWPHAVRAVALAPKSLRALYLAALLAQQRGDVRRSLPYLRRLHALRPSYRDSRFLQAFALQTLGRKNEAAADYRRYLARHPSHFQAHFNLGYLLMKSGRPRDAVPHFLRTLELKPDYHEAHYHLATCYRELGDATEAESHLQRYEQVTGR